MTRIRFPKVIARGEQGHAEPMLGTLIGGAGAIALAIGAWLLVFRLTRTSSLAALIALPLCLPLLAWQQPGALLPMSLLATLIVWRHRSNVRDLFAGRERHF